MMIRIYLIRFYVKIEDMILPKKSVSKVKQTQLLTTEGNYKPKRFEYVTWCDLKKAKGKVLARHIVPYPPGIPHYFQRRNNN